MIEPLDAANRPKSDSWLIPALHSGQNKTDKHKCQFQTIKQICSLYESLLVVAKTICSGKLLVISLGYFKFPELLCKTKSLALHFSSGSLDYDTSDTSTFISYPSL